MRFLQTRLLNDLASKWSPASEIGSVSVDHSADARSTSGRSMTHPVLPGHHSHELCQVLVASIRAS